MSRPSRSPRFGDATPELMRLRGNPLLVGVDQPRIANHPLPFDQQVFHSRWRTEDERGNLIGLRSSRPQTRHIEKRNIRPFARFE